VTTEVQTEDASQTPPSEPAPQKVFDSLSANWWEGGEKVKIGPTFTPRSISNPLDKMTRRHGGRRSRTRTDRKRGRYIRAAAPFQIERKEIRQKLAFAVRTSDFQRKVRVKKAANLILFVVDASWSMAVAERMSATKGAILSLLTDAYQRRDRVGLVVFQKNRATLILPPTNSVQLAQRALADIPVGGKTPLSAGLLMAHEVIQRERILHPDVNPLIILLTDGAGNVSVSELPPQDEAKQLSEKIAFDEIRSVVINMEHAAFDQGLAQTLALHLGAPCYTLSELKAETLYQKVRDEMRD